MMSLLLDLLWFYGVFGLIKLNNTIRFVNVISTYKNTNEQIVQ
jgi:hypothetical protein